MKKEADGGRLSKKKRTRKREVEYGKAEEGEEGRREGGRRSQLQK